MNLTCCFFCSLPLPNVLTWSGSFAAPGSIMSAAYGMTGGPVLYYGANVAGVAVLLSPLDV